MNRLSSVVIVSGVAVAVAALAGSLLVGHSARESLSDLTLSRLGNTTYIVAAPGFLREKLVDALLATEGFRDVFGDACPIIALEGLATIESASRGSLPVDVFGVDDRFWRFHGRSVQAPAGVDAYVSQDLAVALSAATGGAMQLRVVPPSVVPADTLFGRHDDPSRTTLVKVARVLGREDLGDFSLSPRQGAAHVVFVSLDRLQRAIGRSGQVNTILVGRALESHDAELRQAVRAVATLGDLGIQLRTLPERRALAVESPHIFVHDEVAALSTQAAADLGLTARPFLTRLVASIRIGQRQIPYSFVAATTLEGIGSPAPLSRGPGTDLDDPPIVLTDWAAKQLDARVGDQAWLSYATWVGEGRIGNEMARFRVTAVVPTDEATDRDLVPAIPGITGAQRLADWATTLSIDRTRFSATDEDYWQLHGVTPKALIPIDVGRRLWSTPYGSQTSLRVNTSAATPRDLGETYAGRLRALATAAFTPDVRAVRADALQAARGSYDLGLACLLISVFIIAASLLLASSVTSPTLRPEGLAIRVAAGVGLGTAGASGYAALVLHGLRTWWIGATETTELALHVSPFVLIAGSVCAAVLAIAALDVAAAGTERRTRRTRRVGPGRDHQGLLVPLTLMISAGPVGLMLIAASLLGVIPAETGYPLAGGLILMAVVAHVAFLLRHHGVRTQVPDAQSGLMQIGYREAAERPARSTKVISLIATAVFLITSVGSARPRVARDPIDRRSGPGGYSLVAESIVPVLHDLDTTEGQRAVGLSLPLDLPLAGARFMPFKLQPGDDVSQRNLYRPLRPRVLGAREDFLRLGRFRFDGSLAETPDERENPWTLLAKDQPDGAVPVIGDLVSLRSLRLGIGGELRVRDGRGRPVTLRVVAALEGSVFQREVVVAERHFVRLFPDVEGSRFFLIEIEPRWAPALRERLEAQLGRLGLEAQTTARYLAALQRRPHFLVSAFLTLSAVGVGLGLLGFVGVSFARGRDERRAPLSVAAESIWVVAMGLSIGLAAGLVALIPALASYAFYN